MGKWRKNMQNWKMAKNHFLRFDFGPWGGFLGVSGASLYWKVPFLVPTKWLFLGYQKWHFGYPNQNSKNFHSKKYLACLTLKYLAFVTAENLACLSLAFLLWRNRQIDEEYLAFLILKKYLAFLTLWYCRMQDTVRLLQNALNKLIWKLVPHQICSQYEVKWIPKNCRCGSPGGNLNASLISNAFYHRLRITIKNAGHGQGFRIFIL